MTAIQSSSSAIPPSLQECVVSNLNFYLNSCEGQAVTGIYSMVLAAVEKPMLEVIMAHCKDNQSAAAECLGLNRNTLRKKLLEHTLL
jgi:Fis family transcriptional regulator, factor for inversion stimulation protein